MNYSNSKPPAPQAIRPKTLAARLRAPRSKLRGWLATFVAGGVAFGVVSLPPRLSNLLPSWVVLLVLYWFVWGAYEHPNVWTGMLNNARMDRSASRGWLVALIVLFGEVAAGGTTLKTQLDAHSWFSFAVIPVPWWIGYRCYESVNPFPGLWNDVRAMFPPRMIALLVLGIAAFGFSDEIKTFADSVLPNDLRGLALLFIGALVIVAWQAEEQIRHLREQLHGIKDQQDGVADDSRDVLAMVGEISNGVDRVEQRTPECRFDRGDVRIDLDALPISDELRGIRDVMESFEQRAAQRHADDQRQISELLRLTEAVLAHQSPGPQVPLSVLLAAAVKELHDHPEISIDTAVARVLSRGHPQSEV